MQMPAGREHVRQFRPAHEGRVIAVAAADLLHGAAKQHHGVGGHEAHRRLEGEFALARAELDLDRTQRQAERQDVAPDDLEHRLHLVVALLGQILIAVRQQADRGRLAGLAGILRRHLGVFELEDVEFDLEAGDEIVAALVRASSSTDRRDGGSRTAPAARRRNRCRTAASRSPAPRAARESRGIRHHQHVGGALHLPHAEAAAGGEHRKHRAVRGVLGEHRRGDGAAALQRGQRFAGDQRLAAQDAVLVRKRQPDDFELLLFDDAPKAARRLLLLVDHRP